MKNIKKVLFGKVLTVLLIVLFVPAVGFSEVSKTYYESGKLKSESTLKKGKREGPFKEYYESGKLKSEYNFKNGKNEGPCKTYYESGAVQTEHTHKTGKKEGPSKEYYESGKLKKTGTFENGQLINIKEYNEQGKLIK